MPAQSSSAATAVARPVGRSIEAPFAWGAPHCPATRARRRPCYPGQVMAVAGPRAPCPEYACSLLALALLLPGLGCVEPADVAPVDTISSVEVPTVQDPRVDVGSEEILRRNDQIRSHLDGGRADEARSLAEQTLALHVTGSEGLDRLRDTRKLLGAALADLGRAAEAEALLTVALSREDSDHWNCAYQALGVLYSRSTDAEQEHGRPFDATPPPKGDPEANFRAALRYYDASRRPAALAFIERAIALQPVPQFHVVRGFFLLADKRFAEAEEVFRLAAEQVPEDPGAAAGRGHLAIIGREYVDAQAALEPALQRWQGIDVASSTHPGYYDFVHRMICLGLGWLHANQDQHEVAVDYFQRVLASRPYDLLARLGRGNSLMGLGDMDAAEVELRGVLELDPENPYATAELASIGLSRGQLDAAERGFKTALESHRGGYTCPYEGLGMVYLRQGRIQEARTSFEKAIELNPDIEYKKFNGLAEIYLQEGRIDEAERLLEKSIANYPYDSTAARKLQELRSMRATP
ncbi:MAG: hypothetical protein CL928_12260 [Deltaproteobacteria bacterium]|nr:hypothetical protein [Deltaproteobacteria bacterium]